MMGTEMFQIDRVEKLTKTRVSFLMTPTVLYAFSNLQDQFSKYEHILEHSDLVSIRAKSQLSMQVFQQ